MGLGAVSNQYPTPSPPFPKVAFPKSFAIWDGKSASSSRSQGHFSKLICKPKHGASCFLGDSLWRYLWKIFVDASGAVCSVTFQLSLHKANNFLLGPQSNLFCHVIHKPKGAIYQQQPETPEPHAQEEEEVWALVSVTCVWCPLARHVVLVSHLIPSQSFTCLVGNAGVGARQRA